MIIIISLILVSGIIVNKVYSNCKKSEDVVDNSQQPQEYSFYEEEVVI